MIHEITQELYPVTLRNIDKPPNKLYLRGKLPQSSDYKFLCVVGSRLSSSYGRDVCKKLISGLKDYPISIVSGLAIGIDSFAHRVALDVGMHCTAFPGSGIDPKVIYPESRRPLAEQIVEHGGALLSECIPTMLSQNWMFPKRNMHMAALAHATLIIEARQGSGSLMTAKYAEDFGRDVLAPHGSIFSDNSYGPHMLIREGAIPVTSSKDILIALGFEVSENGVVAQPVFNNFDQISKNIITKLSLGDTSYDELIDSLDITTNILNAKISALEMQGLIRVDGTNIRIA